jgi:hypothetical protein
MESGANDLAPITQIQFSGGKILCVKIKIKIKVF